MELPTLNLISIFFLVSVPFGTFGQTVEIAWNNMMVANNSLVSLSVVLQRANIAHRTGGLYPLVCQGIEEGQWYEPNGTLYPAVNYNTGGYGQRNGSAGVELYHGSPGIFPHGVQCCTNTTITLCVGMYSDLTLAASVNLSTSAPTSYALSVAATYGPNITGDVQFQLLTPTNVDPPVFQLTCISTSSPPTTVQWTFNGSPANGGNYTSSQIVTDGPTSTYNNTLTVTGRSPGMYTCNVTTTCSPVCGATGFTLNPRSTNSSINVTAPPGPPTGVTAVQSGPTSVNVSWTAPTSGGPVSRYDIYNVANGVPSTSGGSTTSTSYVLTKLQDGVQYNISVISVGTYIPSDGESVNMTLVPSLTTTQVTSSSTPSIVDTQTVSSSSSTSSIVGTQPVSSSSSTSSTVCTQSVSSSSSTPSIVGTESVSSSSSTSPTVGTQSDYGYTSSGQDSSTISIAVGVIVVVVVIAVVVVGAVVVGHVRRSKRSGSWKLKKQTRDIFSPVEVIVNSQHKNQIDVTEVGEVFEEEVMNQTGVVEANIDEGDGTTEREDGNGPSVDDSTKPMSIASFRDHVQKMHSEGNRGFWQEYKSLKHLSDGPHDIAMLPYNTCKNRFASVYPYDEGRVKLREIPGVEGSDYINASKINGYKYENIYIAAQGPTENTVATFWRMIWENHVQTVVMLTRCVEEGKTKCEQYFSNSTGGIFVTEAIEVTTNSIVPYPDFEIKQLTVRRKVEPDAEPHEITHFHYTSWPDHGVPQFATSILSFVRRVQQAHDKSKRIPLLVHCSAGVGRTGTFITLDAMMECVKMGEESINIYKFVQDMRRKRVLMVQTRDQYVFLHDALDEYITCGETDVLVTNLRARVNKLRKYIPEKGTTGFQGQFQLLDQVSYHVTEDNCTVGAELFNRNKNRYVDRLPYDSKQIYLRSTGAVGSEYINASYIDGYRQRDAYIATQGPLKDTVEDFWRMVWECKSRVIVMLCPLTEEGRESSYCYWPTQTGETQHYGGITVTLQSETFDGHLVVRELYVHEEKDGDGLELTQFHYLEWPIKGVPSSCPSLLDLLQQLTKAQMNSGNKPITVMCDDGMGRTGAFICMHHELERVKAEGVVDVFQCIKASRIFRPYLVQNVEQYIFCHEVLDEYVRSFDTYANFKELTVQLN